MKTSYEFGSSRVEDFWAFIAERHKIWIRRFIDKLSPPWTDDKILQEFKFTNVFRQLDRGTIALHSLLSGEQLAMTDQPECRYKWFSSHELIWTIIWYRMFNWHEHALHFMGKLPITPEILREYIYAKEKRGEKIFTAAHMIAGKAYEIKSHSQCDSIEFAFNQKWEFSSMEDAFDKLQVIPLVGKFIANEMASDLRFTHILQNAIDCNTWANIGPGVNRGLERLGLPSTIDSMVELHTNRPKQWHRDSYPPFELREIGMCLCEFDKYERVRLGQGRPRSNYEATS